MKKLLMSAAAALLALCLILTPSVPAFATGNGTDENGAAAGADTETTYVLTYPNGETVTTTDKAEAEKLQNEWKLLYTGKTDEKGDIVLEGWAEKGEILIREKEVPEGYTAEKTDTTADLSAGSVTIVNKKKPAAVSKAPVTGESRHPMIWVGALCVSAAALALLGLARYRRTRRLH